MPTRIVDRVEVVTNKPGSMTKYRFWRLVAANGETLAHSETYPTKHKCLQTAKQVAKQLGVEVIAK